jgi:hypothetical protein
MHHYGLFVLVLLVIVIVVGAYSAISQSFVGIKFPALLSSSPFRVSVPGILGERPPRAGVTIGIGTPPRNATRAPAPQRATTTPSKPKIVPPAGFTPDQLSSFYGMVNISSLTPTRSLSVPGKFSLVARKASAPGLNVTGWYLKGNRGGSVVIPRAIADYDPSGLTPESDIILKSGDMLNVYIGVTSLQRNVRLNLCMGYFNTTFKTIPSFPNACPRVDRKDIVTFPGACQSFILSLGSCRIPTSNELNQFTLDRDAACHAVLNTLNYRGCYDRYHRRADFLDNEVRVWISQGPFPFDTLHDRILLFDTDGKLVDVHTY